MKQPRRAVSFLVAVMACIVAVGCTQATPPPSPTQAPAAPAKPAEPTKASTGAATAVAPTKAAAAQPTAVPAKKVAFPEKGKAINIIVTWPAGGSPDIVARSLGAHMEKELGISVQLVNRAGASGEIGMAEFVNARPDGYTMGQVSLPTNIASYLDTTRKAPFTRNQFILIGHTSAYPNALAVAAESPYKTTKDLVDAVKASPDKVKVANSGILSAAHLAQLAVEREAKVTFPTVWFDGSAPAITALLGGHVDAGVTGSSNFLPHVKSGKVRILGVLDKARDKKNLPDVPTMEEQGYKAYMTTAQGVAVPAGTPKEIVDILAVAVKNAVASAEFREKVEASGQQVVYLDPAQYDANWAEIEASIKPLIESFKR